VATKKPARIRFTDDHGYTHISVWDSDFADFIAAATLDPDGEITEQGEHQDGRPVKLSTADLMAARKWQLAQGGGHTEPEKKKAPDLAAQQMRRALKGRATLRPKKVKPLSARAQAKLDADLRGQGEDATQREWREAEAAGILDDDRRPHFLAEMQKVADWARPDAMRAIRESHGEREAEFRQGRAQRADHFLRHLSPPVYRPTAEQEARDKESAREWVDRQTGRRRAPVAPAPPPARGFTYTGPDGHKYLRLPPAELVPSFPSEGARQRSHEATEELRSWAAGEEATDARFREGLTARDVGRSELPGARAKAEAERLERRARFAPAPERRPVFAAPAVREVPSIPSIRVPRAPKVKGVRARREDRQTDLFPVNAEEKAALARLNRAIGKRR
jgi:hypothetical protein